MGPSAAGLSMSDLAAWSLAVSVFVAMVALFTLGQRIMSQVLGRVDAAVNTVNQILETRLNKLDETLSREIQHRFDEAERRRSEASALWSERLAAQDRAIDGLRRDLNAMNDQAEVRYVNRDLYIELSGRTMTVLERVGETLKRLESLHG